MLCRSRTVVTVLSLSSLCGYQPASTPMPPQGSHRSINRQSSAQRPYTRCQELDLGNSFESPANPRLWYADPRLAQLWIQNGQIVGIPNPQTRFGHLSMGMNRQQASVILGQPTTGLLFAKNFLILPGNNPPAHVVYDWTEFYANEGLITYRYDVLPGRPNPGSTPSATERKYDASTVIIGMWVNRFARSIIDVPHRVNEVVVEYKGQFSCY